MESISLNLNNAELYDKALRECVQECGDLNVVTKPNCTVGGKTGVLIGFTAMVNNQPVAVQVTTTAALFIQAAKAIELSLEELKHD